MKRENCSNLHENAIRLLEGGIVWFDNHSLKLADITYDLQPCLWCDLDCACSESIKNLCQECDSITQSQHIMILSENK